MQSRGEVLDRELKPGNKQHTIFQEGSLPPLDDLEAPERDDHYRRVVAVRARSSMQNKRRRTRPIKDGENEENTDVETTSVNLDEPVTGYIGQLKGRRQML